MRVDCKEYARQIESSTLKIIKYSNPMNPQLVVFHDDNPGSAIYRKMIAKDCERLGVHLIDQNSFDVHIFDGYNKSGIPILFQMPTTLCDREYIESILNPVLDMDGISVENAGRLYQGIMHINKNTCTAQAVSYIVDGLYGECKDLNCVVIGRSNTVGKPVMMSMLERNASVSIFHSASNQKDIDYACKNADIVVIASSGNLVYYPENFKKESTVIDISECCAPEVADEVQHFVGKGNNLGCITRAILMNRVFSYYANQ